MPERAILKSRRKLEKTNEELWEELRKGSRDAIDGLYRSNYQVMYSYAYKICRDKELSKDCVQELFVMLWEKRTQLKEVSKVRSYLLQSVWHLTIKKQKKYNSVSLDENAHYDIDVVFSIESVLINKSVKEEKKKQLEEALGKLSNRQKQIIFMQYYEGMSMEEIQSITELKYQSIKNLTHRAMLTLREIFNVKKK